LLAVILLAGCSLTEPTEPTEEPGGEMDESPPCWLEEDDQGSGEHGETTGAEACYREDPVGPPVDALYPTYTPLPSDFGLPYKPVGFINSGSIAATVMAWTFVPLGSDTPAIPSPATTVTFPPTAPGLWPNSSRFLSLPLGTYTWCYWWEIGDINNDSYIEYMHAFDERTVILDENDSDNTELAESVDLVVPPGGTSYPGKCDFSNPLGLDIRPFIAASYDPDEYPWAFAGVSMAHHGDYVTLAGPITVEYYFMHRLTYDDPFVVEPTQTVVIGAGETRQFTLEENTSEHPGDWNLFIRLISIDG
jgi:hypothetical protein